MGKSRLWSRNDYCLQVIGLESCTTIFFAYRIEQLRYGEQQADMLSVLAAVVKHNADSAARLAML